MASRVSLFFIVMSFLCIDFGTAKIKTLMGIQRQAIDFHSNSLNMFPPCVSSGKEGILFGEAAEKCLSHVGMTVYPVMVPFLNPQAGASSSLDYWKSLYNVDCDLDSKMYLHGMDEYKEYAYPVSVFSIWLSSLYSELMKSFSKVNETYVSISPLVSRSAAHGLLESMSIAKMPSPRVVYQPFCAVLDSWKSVQSKTRIMVIDLGATYFTTSFVANQDNSLSLLDTVDEILFGGHDIDNSLAMQIRDQYRRYNYYINIYSEQYSQLLKIAERTKRALCEQTVVEVTIENSPCSITVKREAFSRLIEYPMKQMVGFIGRHTRSLGWDDGSFVTLVVGGNARNDEIVRFIREGFPTSRIIIPDNVETSTIRGLSIAGTIERCRRSRFPTPEYPWVQLLPRLLYSLAIQYEGREEVILEKGQPLLPVRKRVDVQSLWKKQLTLVELMDQLIQTVWTIDLDTDQAEVVLEIAFNENNEPYPRVDGNLVNPRPNCSLNEDERTKLSGVLDLQRRVSNTEFMFQNPSLPLRKETLKYLQSIEEKLPIIVFQRPSEERFQYISKVHLQLEMYLNKLFSSKKKPYSLSVCS